jgi:hypothetical protein
MSDFSKLIYRLRKDASIQASEQFDDQKIAEWIRAAIVRHVPEQARGSTPSISDENDEAVIALAWESLSYARAAKFVNQTDARGANASGTDDRTSPYARNMNMARAQRQRYNDIVEQYATTSAGESIIQGKLSIRSSVTDQYSGPQRPITLGLQAENITATSCDLLFSIGYSEMFADAFLYFSNDTIFEATAQSNDDGIPSIADDAELLGKIEDQFATLLRVTDLTPASTYTFLLVVKSRNGRYYYSNEIVVVTPNA